MTPEGLNCVLQSHEVGHALYKISNGKLLSLKKTEHYNPESPKG